MLANRDRDACSFFMVHTDTIPRDAEAIHSYHSFIMLARMNSSILITLSFFLLLSLADAADPDHNIYSAPFDARDDILLSCRTTGPSPVSYGRQWTGDTGSKYSPSLTSEGPTATGQDPSAPAVPCNHARVFTSSVTYSFPLQGPGRKFLRLHFCLSSYSGLDGAKARFSVTAGNITLLSNFSAYQTGQALKTSYMIREYSVNILSSSLNLTFAPSKSVSNSFAFVNGIEVLSIPADLLSTTLGTPQLVYGGPWTQNYPIGQSAVENVYRLNVGGQGISPSQDSGLFRQWDNDLPYVYDSATGVVYPSPDPNVTIQYYPQLPAYIAPKSVYESARAMGPSAAVNRNSNLTWILPVDAGLRYFVRLHFCEVMHPFTHSDMRVFDVFINNQTAVEQVDVIALTQKIGNRVAGGIGYPYYYDFVVMTIGTGRVSLWVALHPNETPMPMYANVILNGLEVFKLERDGNLAGPNPDPQPQMETKPNVKVSPSPEKKSNGHVGEIAGGAAGGIAVLVIVCFLVFVVCKKQRKKGGNDSGTSNGKSGWFPLSPSGNFYYAKTSTTGKTCSSLLPSNLRRYFSSSKIEAAANVLDEASPLGGVGFGKVHCDKIDGGSTKMAIKRANPMSDQGAHEFETEIEMLSNLRHSQNLDL